ncbi:hypothetical protein FKM82_012507 [Ascaphus truei]
MWKHYNGPKRSLRFQCWTTGGRLKLDHQLQPHVLV